MIPPYHYGSVNISLQISAYVSPVLFITGTIGSAISVCDNYKNLIEFKQILFDEIFETISLNAFLLFCN